MGAVASRHLRPLSEIFELVYFTGKKGISSYMGWHGVGMSMAAKAVAKAAKESKLFDVVVLVRAGEKCRPRKLQTRLAKQLGIIHRDDDDDDDSEEEVDKEVGSKIYESLGRKFLLIIDDLRQGIKLGSLGVPTPSEWVTCKIFLTTPNWEVISAMNADDINILSEPQLEEEAPRSAPDVTYTIEIEGVDELLEHFRDEAGDVADAVSNNNAIGDLRVQVSRDQVFDCFIYLCLLQRQEANEKELMRYCVGEGFITTQQLVDGQERSVENNAFEVGKAVLGEMASRWMVERSPDDGKLSMNSRLWKILERKEGIDCLKKLLHIQLEATHALEIDVERIALSNNNNIPTLLLQQYKNPQLSTLLLHNNPQLTQIPDNFFLGIPNLRVLDLSRTSISSLPPSLSSLVHLRFLKLRECSSLNSLPPTPLKHLNRLIILDLHGTPMFDVPTEAFEQKPELRLLDLSHTNIHSLSRCASLIRRLSALEEIDISGCKALKDVENAKFEDMPKVRAINLCNIQITRLSFTRCRSLEIVRLQGLANLKSLHLSSVKIKEFPSEISELKGLEQLRLIDVQHLERVNWKKVRWLPEKLEWDQCGCSAASALRPEEQAGNRDANNDKAASAIVSVSNANIFKGIDVDSPIWENCFSKFHIYICPCGKQKEKKEKEEAAVVDVKRRKMPRVYARIHSRINGNFEKEVEGLSRHLEIEGIDGVLHRDVRSSIMAVAGKAEVLWLRGNGFVKSLATDFGVESDAIEGVKECRVERCHNMDHLFPEDLQSGIWGLKGRLWVSDMGTLRSLYLGPYYFTHLKHLHIECCPKLDKLFGANTRLYELETLHIRFCARLEQLHDALPHLRGEWAFPKLRILHLWELPKLNHICGWYLPPSLEKLRVRACPKLQRLPPISTYPKVRLTIEGESDWWTNLNWDNQKNIKKEAIKFKSSNANNP